MLWAYLCLGVIADTLIGVYAKQYIESNQWVYFLYLIPLTIFSFWLWFAFLKLGNFGPLVAIWMTMVLVGSVILGRFYFQEPLSHLQVIGIACCVLGVLLIQWPTK